MRLEVKDSEWWYEHVDAWRKTQLSQSEYCRKHSLHIKSFSNWKLKQDRELSAIHANLIRNNQSPENVGFVSVQFNNENCNLTKSLQANFSGLSLIVDDCRVVINNNFNPSTLRELLSVLTDK